LLLHSFQSIHIPMYIVSVVIGVGPDCCRAEPVVQQVSFIVCKCPGPTAVLCDMLVTCNIAGLVVLEFLGVITEGICIIGMNGRMTGEWMVAEVSVRPGRPGFYICLPRMFSAG